MLPTDVKVDAQNLERPRLHGRGLFPAQMLPTMRWMMLTASFVSLTQCVSTNQVAKRTRCPGSVHHQGKGYGVVELDGHCWMAEDLASHQFLNGDSIPMGFKDQDWHAATSSAAEQVGHAVLYNWYAVTDSRGLCPQGWHVPSTTDWQSLIDACGGEGHAGASLKSKAGWDERGNGTNKSGFAAKPSGSKEFSGYVSGQGCYGYWWSSTPAPPYVSTVELNCLDNQAEIREDYDTRDGFSVRCIKVP